MIKSEYRVSRDGNKIGKCCLESEVRQLESDYAKLEARLGEAVEIMSAACPMRWLFDEDSYSARKWEIRVRNFLTTLDQEKEKSDEV